MTLWKRNFLLYLAFIAACVFAKSTNASETNIIDSLEQKILSCNNDSLKIKLYRNLSEAHLEFGDIRTAQELALEEYRLAKKIKHVSEVLYSILDFATCRSYARDFKTCNSLTQIVLEIAKNINNKFIQTYCHHRIATNYYYKQQIDSAIYTYLHATKVISNEDTIQNMFVVYNNLGNLYYQKNDLIPALDMYSKAMGVAIKFKNESYQALIDMNLASVHLVLDNIDECTSRVNKSVDFYKKDATGIFLPNCYILRSQLYERKHQYKKMLQDISSAEKLAIERKRPDVLVDVYSLLSRFYLNEIFNPTIEYDSIKEADPMYASYGNENLLNANIKTPSFEQLFMSSLNKLSEIEEQDNMDAYTQIVNLKSEYLEKKKLYQASNKQVLSLINIADSTKIDLPEYDLIPRLIRNYKNQNDYKSAFYWSQRILKNQEKLLYANTQRKIGEVESNIAFKTKSFQDSLTHISTVKLLHGKIDMEKRTISFNQKIVYLSTISFLIFGCLFFIIRRKNRQVIQQSTLLKDQSLTLFKVKQKIQARYIKIEQSIVYARKIQTAILPSSNKIFSHRDGICLTHTHKQVSGNFFGTGKLLEKEIYYLIGTKIPGVPGALIGIMTVNLLFKQLKNRMIDYKSIVTNVQTELGNILNKKNNQMLNYSVDIAICSISEKKIEFAGKNISLQLYQDNQLCSYKSEKTIALSNQILKKSKNTLFLFTDSFKTHTEEKSSSLKKELHLLTKKIISNPENKFLEISSNIKDDITLLGLSI